MMMSIVGGSIQVAGHKNGHLGTAGLVTRADFKGYKAVNKHTLAILAQKIEGDRYTIGSLPFTTKEESVLHRL